MVDKRTTLKISEIEVAESFRGRAVAESKTQTQLLKELLSKDYSFEQTTKMSNRIEHNKNDSFNHICSEYSKKINKEGE